MDLIERFNEAYQKDGEPIGIDFVDLDGEDSALFRLATEEAAAMGHAAGWTVTVWNLETDDQNHDALCGFLDDHMDDVPVTRAALLSWLYARYALMVKVFDCREDIEPEYRRVPGTSNLAIGVW